MDRDSCEDEAAVVANRTSCQESLVLFVVDSDLIQSTTAPLEYPQTSAVSCCRADRRCRPLIVCTTASAVMTAVVVVVVVVAVDPVAVVGG